MPTGVESPRHGRNRAAVVDCPDHIQGRSDDGAMARFVPHRTHWPPKRMSSDQRAGQCHHLGDVTKGGYVDTDCADAGLLGCPRDVPDRHVTNGSHRHQQQSVEPVPRQGLDPFRQHVE